MAGPGRSLLGASNKRRSGLLRFSLCLLGCAATVDPGWAGAQARRLEKTAAQHRDENGEALHEAKSPIALTLTYISDANAGLSGGERTGTAYLQRIGALVDADLATAVGWRGASFHMSVHAISGQGLSEHRVGNILTVSGIEAEPAFRLFNLWIEQALRGGGTLRLGQFTAGQEFAISTTANLFINSTFGWPASFATDLPSGGPAYPLAAPGIRISAVPDDRTTVRLAMFSGDPAGQGHRDPQRRDLHGFNGWRLTDKPLVIAEIVRASSASDPAWALTLGGWIHFDRFADQRYDGAHASLASPTSTGEPLQHRNDAAIYAIVDLRLLQASDRALHGFVRATASPADRNPVDIYADAGLSLTAPLAGRPADVAGIAVSIAHISKGVRRLVQDRAALLRQPLRPPALEAVVEATYQARLRPGLSIQPNVQVILSPSASLVSDPLSFGRTPGTAFVGGLRTSLRF